MTNTSEHEVNVWTLSDVRAALKEFNAEVIAYSKSRVRCRKSARHLTWCAEIARKVDFVLFQTYGLDPQVRNEIHATVNNRLKVMNTW